MRGGGVAAQAAHGKGVPAPVCLRRGKNPVQRRLFRGTVRPGPILSPGQSG